MDPPRAADAGLLAQPARRALLARLAELHRPASTAELADHAGRHPNGVREHLVRMAAAGLLVRERPPRPRGRPRDMWSLSARARGSGAAPSAYGDLARWLARALAADPRGPATIARAGRAIGRELAVPAAASSARPLEPALAALGFAPHAQGESRDAVAYRLCNCPYREVVRERAELICALHRGITEGLLDSCAPAWRLAEFEPAADPDAAGCRVRLERGKGARGGP